MITSGSCNHGNHHLMFVRRYHFVDLQEKNIVWNFYQFHVALLSNNQSERSTTDYDKKRVGKTQAGRSKELRPAHERTRVHTASRHVFVAIKWLLFSRVSEKTIYLFWKKHFKCTTQLYWFVLIDDESLWQEILTKEAKEFEDSLSTVKDDMMNDQGKHCIIIFEQQQANFSRGYLWVNSEEHC